MNKRDFAKALAVQADIDLKTALRVVDAYSDLATAVTAKGEVITLTGFAKFAKVERAARMGRNPATGETIRIKASKKAKITPLKGFKDAVLSPSLAPKLERGAWPIDEAAVRAAGAPAKAAALAAKAPAKRAPAKKAAPARKAPAKKAPAKKAPARKAPARKAPARKAPARRR
jgi:DNA-binding protein HU-beta